MEPESNRRPLTPRCTYCTGPAVHFPVCQRCDQQIFTCLVCQSFRCPYCGVSPVSLQTHPPGLNGRSATLALGQGFGRSSQIPIGFGPPVESGTASRSYDALAAAAAFCDNAASASSAGAGGGSPFGSGHRGSVAFASPNCIQNDLADLLRLNIQQQQQQQRHQQPCMTCYKLPSSCTCNDWTGASNRFPATAVDGSPLLGNGSASQTADYQCRLLLESLLRQRWSASDVTPYGSGYDKSAAAAASGRSNSSASFLTTTADNQYGGDMRELCVRCRISPCVCRKLVPPPSQQGTSSPLSLLTIPIQRSAAGPPNPRVKVFNQIDLNEVMNMVSPTSTCISRDRISPSSPSSGGPGALSRLSAGFGNITVSSSGQRDVGLGDCRRSITPVHSLSPADIYTPMIASPTVGTTADSLILRQPNASGGPRPGQTAASMVLRLGSGAGDGSGVQLEGNSVLDQLSIAASLASSARLTNSIQSSIVQAAALSTDQLTLRMRLPLMSPDRRPCRTASRPIHVGLSFVYVVGWSAIVNTPTTVFVQLMNDVDEPYGGPTLPVPEKLVVTARLQDDNGLVISEWRRLPGRVVYGAVGRYMYDVRPRTVGVYEIYADYDRQQLPFIGPNVIRAHPADSVQYSWTPAATEHAPDTLPRVPRWSLMPAYDVPDLRKTWGACLSPDGQLLLFPERDTNRIVIEAMNASQPRRVFGVEGYQPGEFKRPTSMAFDSRRRVVVVDKDNHRLQVFVNHASWELFAVVGGPLAGAGDEEFNYPWAVAVNRRDELLVADSKNMRVVLLALTPTGYRNVGKFSLTTVVPGRKMEPRKDGPRGVAFTHIGCAVVCDYDYGNVLLLTPDVRQLLQSIGDTTIVRPRGVAVHPDTDALVIVVSRANRHQNYIVKLNPVDRGQRGRLCLTATVNYEPLSCFFARIVHVGGIAYRLVVTMANHTSGAVVYHVPNE